MDHHERRLGAERTLQSTEYLPNQYFCMTFLTELAFKASHDFTSGSSDEFDHVRNPLTLCRGLRILRSIVQFNLHLRSRGLLVPMASNTIRLCIRLRGKVIHSAIHPKPTCSYHLSQIRQTDQKASRRRLGPLSRAYLKPLWRNRSQLRPLHPPSPHYQGQRRRFNTQYQIPLRP